MNFAHVICLNDYPELVVLEDIEKAKIELAKLQRAYYDKTLTSWNGWEDYIGRVFWHIETVEYIRGGKEDEEDL